MKKAMNADRTTINLPTPLKWRLLNLSPGDKGSRQDKLIKALCDDYEALKEENTQLKNQNQVLADEIEILEAQIKTLREERGA